MVELVQYIARSLVDRPDMVRVRECEEDDGHLILLSVDQDDMGKIIGKHGRIAKAIRSVVKAASHRAPSRYTVEIVDDVDKEPEQ